MAMLPVLLDFVDDIYSNLDDQSRAFGNSVPLFFVPQRSNDTNSGQEARCRRGPMRGCQMQKPAGWTRRCQRGNCAAAKPVSGDFEMAIDVQSFKPEEIAVKVKGHEIIIEGKHEEREDEFGIVTRQFSRRCLLPQEFDPDTVSTVMNAEGRMTIKATKPQPPPAETTERIIPIQRLPAATSETSSTEQEREKVDEASGENSKKPQEQVKE